MIKSFLKKVLSTRSFTAIAAVFIAMWGVALAQSVIANMQFEAESGVLSGSVSQGSDSVASNGSYIRFNQPPSSSCPAGQVGTPPNCVPANQALSVNAGTVVNKFDRKIKGVGLANWNFSWGRPYAGDVPNLAQAMSAIDPGIIRYAGGLWANYVGFDRNRQQQRPYESDWVSNGNTYSFNYGTNELIDLDGFAKSINAEVMIQVNISNNDPGMWADLVRFAKERGLTSIKYYELGNELDLETMVGNSAAITPATYASRLAAYQQAMLAVDPTIKIVGGVPAATSDIMRNNWSCCGNQVSQYITQGAAAARNAGRDLGAASIHWYQTSDAVGVSDVFHWSWGFPSSSGDWWRNSYSREWSGLVTPWVKSAGLGSYPNVPVGVSELGVNSSDNITLNGNHVSALWYSDVLGRFAYTGTDWITQWNSYASSGEYFSLLYPDNPDSSNPTINARPSYLAYLMYSKYFGDQMVQSSTFDATKLSIWASKDSDDPGKLKLRITNMTGSAINAPIALNGFTATNGQAYTLSSTNPLDTSAASTTSQAPTTINGVKVNAANVNGSLANIQPTNVAVNGTSFTYSIPAYSSVAIVLSGSF